MSEKKYQTVYPKYSDSENKSKKYTQEQIKEIKQLQQEGLSYWKVAKKLGLPFSSVRYVCMTEEQKREFNEMKYKTRKTPNIHKKNYNKDRRERKGEKILQYMREQKKEYIAIEENREKKKLYMEKYRAQKKKELQEASKSKFKKLLENINFLRKF